MGAGLTYQYHHFMLIDINHPHYEEDDEDNIIMNLMDHIKEMADGIDCDKELSENAQVYFKTDHVYYGANTSGVLPALFAVPCGQYNEQDERDCFELYTEAGPEIIETFNKAVKSYSTIFRKPTSQWTSEPYRTSYV